jgi:hypothetical protein
LKDSDYKYQEALLMSKIDDLTAEFEELRNGLKSLRV